jgi:hypothetical protein
VKYFSSVPYILQMMEADEKGLEFLQGMEIVGVGGAALPAEVGDRLVKNKVNLISRFGSAECGFILSSYREFSVDKDWQYLRNYNPPKLVEFEGREDGLAELVIKPGWPHMVFLIRCTESYDWLTFGRRSKTVQTDRSLQPTSSRHIPLPKTHGCTIRAQTPN